MKKFRVYVTYKPSVFDPQGDTITEAAKDLGYQPFKQFTLENSLILKLTIQRKRLTKRLKN